MIDYEAASLAAHNAMGGRAPSKNVLRAIVDAALRGGVTCTHRYAPLVGGCRCVECGHQIAWDARLVPAPPDPRTAQSAPYNAESRSGNPYYERARVGDCPPEVVRDQRGAVCGTTCPTCGDSKTVMVREGAGGPIVATAPCPACTQPAREEGAAIESHPVRIRGGVDRAPQNPAGSGESGVAPHLGHFTEPSGRNQSGEAPSNRIWHLESDLSSWGPACGRELASDGIAYTPSGVTCKECRAIVEAAPPITPPAPASRGEGAVTYAEAARAVCGYCNGHHPPFYRVVAGPNAAGNYVHERRGGLHGNGEAALCAASGLWSLRAWNERGGLPHFITEE